MTGGTVYVAMSGGVDSAVAAALLVERGEDVVGVWMRLVPRGSSDDAPRCCGTDEAGEQASRAAHRLGIPFYALDYVETFGRTVVAPFVEAYAAGRTPNPCVACNAHVKFDALLHDVRAKLGGSRLATGHWARLARDATGRRRLLRARDAAKDQSYALYMLGPAVLDELELPIGELPGKAEARRIAARHGLPNAAAAESQDICFVAGDHRDLLRARVPAAFAEGPVERADGTVVGRHGGIASLTVGQRRGVGVAAGERVYVLSLDPAANRAVVGRADEVRVVRHELGEVRFTAGRPPAREFTASAVLRYRGEEIPASVTVGEGDTAVVRLARPALVAPGQALVLYDGDEVLGGGVVRRSG